jgi:serine/threonine protein kinase
MDKPHQSEEAIFEAALQWPPEQRAAYVKGACGENAQLRQSVEALLRAHEKTGGFLDQPPPGLGPEKTIRLDIPPAEKPGDSIGRYKLLQQIGEGGCGVVYMAEQAEPVRRRVALKVIKLGMDTKDVIARFEAERQALALMDHPNLAKVLDAGATETGRPYFVMELVRGVRITDYCDQNNLTAQQRLELFICVCQAIQHAHQKGVIHRDIKPSNILVADHDGVPVPKVIDFGIAKATTGQRLTDKTLFTAFEQFIGTPAYMSPEQAKLSGLDIDTRSDIYSLGVLLYELLTGKTPFEAQELLAAGLDEMRRVIREKDPPRPSARLSTLTAVEQTTIARCRRSEPLKLIHLVRGDLDWIVMKCLEKDRTRRYETANGFARDIERHLRHEPVSVVAPALAYQLSKFARRHRTALATSVGFILLLATSAVLSTWEAIRANRNAAEAGKQAIRAAKAANGELQERQRVELLAEENQQNLYAARINLAQQTFEQGDVTHVLDLLDSLRPARGQEDMRGFEWHYLWRLCHNERLNLVGHEARVRAVAFAPNGLTLATAGNDLGIRLWDTSTGQKRGSLDGHTGWVSSLSFSPDGALLASASADRTVRLWDFVLRKEVFRFEGFGQDVTGQVSGDGGQRYDRGWGSVEKEE